VLASPGFIRLTYLSTEQVAAIHCLCLRDGESAGEAGAAAVGIDHFERVGAGVEAPGTVAVRAVSLTKVTFVRACFHKGRGEVRRPSGHHGRETGASDGDGVSMSLGAEAERLQSRWG